jgi:hypothetical protein
MASPRSIIDVHVGGKDRPIRFGMAAQAEFCDIRDVPLSVFDDEEESDETGAALDERMIGGREMRIGDVIVLLYVALKDGARKRAQQGQQPPRPPRSWHVVADWLDEMSEEKQQRVTERIIEHVTAAGKSQTPPDGEKEKRAATTNSVETEKVATPEKPEETT